MKSNRTKRKAPPKIIVKVKAVTYKGKKGYVLLYPDGKEGAVLHNTKQEAQKRAKQSSYMLTKGVMSYIKKYKSKK